MVVAQGGVYRADLGAPSGSEPGFRRPVLVIQGHAFDRSRIATVARVPLTSDLALADAPGNVLLRARATRLPKDSVANVSQLVTLDRGVMRTRIGRVSGVDLARARGRRPGPRARDCARAVGGRIRARSALSSASRADSPVIRRPRSSRSTALPPSAQTAARWAIAA
ncbi:MAG: type II toxin-antitoxin system PemK/MazF family toxin [Chloroflexi bacterium]|nr:type II toxin-antitoxin system PemK/MazF family toxin [Chloroflexota bacterium]